MDRDYLSAICRGVFRCDCFSVYFQALGWIMSSTTILIVLAGGTLQYLRMGRPADLGVMLRPTEKWGPSTNVGGRRRSREEDIPPSKTVTGFANEAFSI